MDTGTVVVSTVLGVFALIAIPVFVYVILSFMGYFCETKTPKNVDMYIKVRKDPDEYVQMPDGSVRIDG